MLPANAKYFFLPSTRLHSQIGLMEPEVLGVLSVLLFWTATSHCFQSRDVINLFVPDSYLELCVCEDVLHGTDGAEGGGDGTGGVAVVGCSVVAATGLEGAHLLLLLLLLATPQSGEKVPFKSFVLIFLFRVILYLGRKFISNLEFPAT